MKYRNHLCRASTSSLLIALMSLACLLAGCNKAKSGPPPRETVPVTVAPAVQKDVPLNVKAVGNVEPYSTVSVKSMIAGEITRVAFQEGQDVKKGDLLFVIDPRPYEAALAQAKGNLARDTAQAANAKAQAERYLSLFKAGVISKEQTDQVLTAANAMQETVSADQAAVETAKVNLTYCSIYSPIDGRTGNLMVHQGNVVKANDVALVTINQVQPIYVTFAVPEQYLPEVKKHLVTHKLTVTANVPNEPKPAVGVLTFVDNSVDPATGTIKLKGTFTNADRRLWPGQFSDVSLTLTTQANAVLVPTAAVQTGQNGTYVFVVKEDGTAEMRPVTVDRILEAQTVLRSGVKPGEQVVTDGQLRLMPGSKVAVSGPTASSTNAQSTQPPARQGNGL